MSVLIARTAARVLGALPRATAVASVAVPTQRRPLRLTDRDGEIRFSARTVADLDAVLVTTDLGQALATTPEQTVLDLARADPRGELTLFHEITACSDAYAEQAQHALGSHPLAQRVVVRRSWYYGYERR